MKISVQAKEFAVQISQDERIAFDYYVEGYACQLDTATLGDALMALITEVQAVAAKVQEQCSQPSAT